MNKAQKIISLIFLLLISLSHNEAILALDDDEPLYQDYKELHRINAHGDEFMSLALSSDEKKIVVGTEKGELIVWNIDEGRVEKRFKQDSPIHRVKFLNDNHYVIVAGGSHTDVKDSCSLRKWNITNGTFSDFKGCGNYSLFYLATDNESGLVAAANPFGYVAVWETMTGKQVVVWDTKKITTGLELINKKIYLTQTTPEEFKNMNEDETPSFGVYTLSIDSPKQNAQTFIPKKAERSLNVIEPSPDKHYLAITGYESEATRVFIFDALSGNIISSFEDANARWISNERLLLSSNGDPSEIVTIKADGKTQIQELNKGGNWHKAGNPAEMTDQAVSKDGRKIWETFQLTGSLIEFDLEKDDAKILIDSNSFPFAMSVRESADGAGYLATGGDDKFVRVWNLNDLSLQKEFQVSVGVPQGVALLTDGKRVVFSSSTKDAPTEIFVGDISTGEKKKILSVNQPFISVRAGVDGFVYNYKNKLILASADNGSTMREFIFENGLALMATSTNAKWMAVADGKGYLWLVDLTTGNQKQWSKGIIEETKKIAVTNDGRYVYTTEWYAKLRRWDTSTQESTELTQHRGQAACLSLSADEQYVIIGGNHRDVGVYDAKTGKTIFYSRVEASDFYVTNAWMRGRRLIFTTDGGVMFDWSLKK